MAPGDLQDPYDMIIIGRGSAAADYLVTVPRRYKSLDDSEPLPMTILVIGEQDPWAKGRGYVKGAYAQYVNQAQQVLQRRTADTAPTSQGPQDRLEFAHENEEILESLATEVIEDTVRHVSRLLDTQGRFTFKVEAGSGKFYGRKIVFASGAGIEGDKGHADYHAVPGEVTKAWPGGRPAAVMNLDEFIALSATQSLGGKTVAVLGPTAGTDAVMNALTLRVPPQHLFWLMRGEPTTKGFANVYPGNTPNEKQRIATAQKIAANNIIAYANDTLVLSDGSSGKISVRCTQTNAGTEPLQGLKVQKNFTVLVDYFIYSIGQPGGNTLTAPPEEARAKATSVLDGPLQNALEPVYDINQRLGSAPWEHVTAVQLGGSTSDEGVLIIGAATFQAAAKIDHNFLQRDFDELRTNLLHHHRHFESCARAYFAELLTPGGLKDVPRLTVDKCNAKQNALVEAWRKHVSEHLEEWAKTQLISFGDKTARITKLVNPVIHLCYLFKQRCQAATYLFHEDGKGRSVQDLLKPSHTLPDSLSDCRLLAAVNANISALNASSPGHLAKKTTLDPLDVGVEIHANFLEDQTELRCYIAAHYPNIPEHAARAFIDEVGRERKKLGNLGFDRPKIVEFERKLEGLEKHAAVLHQ